MILEMRITETVIERLTGLRSAALVKRTRVFGPGHIFVLDFGNDWVSVYPTQEMAHKGFAKINADLLKGDGKRLS